MSRQEIHGLCSENLASFSEEIEIRKIMQLGGAQGGRNQLTSAQRQDEDDPSDAGQTRSVVNKRQDED